MNINRRFKCDTCDTIIDCRIGMSNRDIQPFQFACPNCEERITFVIKDLNNPDWELSGASGVDLPGMFTNENPFIDLHLDFPAKFDEYVPGMTSFMKATIELGDGYWRFRNSLDLLNELYSRKKELYRVINQFKLGNTNAFKTSIQKLKLPGVKVKSNKRQDIIAALYSATTSMSSPFVIHEQNIELSVEMPKLLCSLHTTYPLKMVEFIDLIYNNGFLKNLHHDCLSLYPKMIDLDLPVRPAIYYDYVEDIDFGKIPARISTSDFDTCNNFYKDLSEVFSRMLVLVAGINNLLKRGDYDKFEDAIRMDKNSNIRKELATLNAFANMDLGRKLDCIDDCFYNIDSDALDNKLRNAIAHYKYVYKESTQIITYYPRKEGMERVKFHELYFIEFMRKTLLLFREVHNLNHIIKSLLFFSICILRKPI